MASADSASFHVGVDENGLGPRLGPLLVTAVLGRIAGERERLNRLRDSVMADRLGDSKGLVSHRDVALGEAWARVLVERGAGRGSASCDGTAPSELSAEHVLHALSLDDRNVLQAPCPAHVEAQCWSTEHDPAAPSRRLSELCDAVRADLGELGHAGLEVVAVRSVIVCTRQLNDAAREGRNRLRVDLHAMERLVLETRAIAGQDVVAVCGKVGGFRDYGKVLGPLGDRLRTVVEETRGRSAYRIAGVGEVSFVRDADESDLLVGLASLVGKYLRELLMGRIVQHYRQAQPELPDASGYNDPVTARFMSETEHLRRDQQVPATCFERFGRSGLDRDR